jgi:hypothetical protein
MDFIQQSKINNQQLLFNKNPSSSNKTRTVDTSTCTGSRAISPSNSDSTAPDQPPSPNLSGPARLP